MPHKTEFKFEGVDPVTKKKFKITLDGWIPTELLNSVQEQINRIVMGRQTKLTEHLESQFIDVDSWTIKDKIKHLIFKQFKHGWFNSRDLIDQYKVLFNEKIKPSTASMVLRRLTKDDNTLERRGSKAQHMYRLISENVTEDIQKAESIKLLK